VIGRKAKRAEAKALGVTVKAAHAKTKAAAKATKAAADEQVREARGVAAAGRRRRGAAGRAE
jgi:hypothetical protein